MIDHWVPANLPDLEILYLEGTPALSFHPDTLHTTLKLKELNIELMPYDPFDRAFIPAEEELERADEIARQANDLIKPGNQHPSLTAFLAREQDRPSDKKVYQRFDFNRNGTHSTKNTSNKTVSVEEGDEEEEDKNKEEKRREDQSWRGIEYLCLPKLTTLRLEGPWLLDERASDVLFEIMAPMITSLS
ncbi:hypothetical protein FBU30_007231 [Linnemannia zychae]|nr:hypothetical protein FBU30_007231 [Linnemannia zychae]